VKRNRNISSKLVHIENVIGLAKSYTIIILALNRTKANLASNISFVVDTIPPVGYPNNTIIVLLFICRISRSLCRSDEISFQSDGLRKNKKKVSNRYADLDEHIKTTSYNKYFIYCKISIL
jgi:hypothetical protein